MHADLALARRVDAAEIEFCALGGGAAPGFGRLDLDGATALYAAPGSPLNNELGARLQRPGQWERGGGAPVVAVERTSHDEEWVAVVSRGFAAGESHVTGAAAEAPGPGAEDLAPAMRAFVHPQVVRYLARVEGIVAGGGAAWEHGGVLGVFGTATLPEFRRRGVQRAITVAALAGASPAAELAIATTAPGSTSQRTFERLGFRVLYTRALFVRPPA